MDATLTLRRLQVVAQRCRSIAAESVLQDVSAMLDPIAYGDGPLSILAMTEAMLAKRGGPDQMDAFNALVMANRSPTIPVMWGVMLNEDLPEAAEALIPEGDPT